MNITHFPIALFIPYVLLTLGNAICRRLRPEWAFSDPEILTVLAMGLVGAGAILFSLRRYRYFFARQRRTIAGSLVSPRADRNGGPANSRGPFDLCHFLHLGYKVDSS